MTTNVCLPASSYAALKEYAREHKITVSEAAAVAVEALSTHVVVASAAEGRLVVVEVYTRRGEAVERQEELIDVGFIVSVIPRAALTELSSLRRYGPAWIEATGWTRSLPEEDLRQPPAHKTWQKRAVPGGMVSSSESSPPSYDAFVEETLDDWFNDGDCVNVTLRPDEVRELLGRAREAALGRRGGE